MVPLTSLWLPILLSAVAVFIASSIIHMALPYHRSDLAKLPGEDQVMNFLGQQNIPPGDYMFPSASSMSQMKDPAFVEKRKRGPVGLMTIYPGGSVGMGSQLAQWFVYSLVISLFAAYLTSHALPRGAMAIEIFRYVSTLGFMGYGLGLVHDSVWYGRKWSSTIKNLIDGFIYGAVTALVFIWLWPHA